VEAVAQDTPDGPHVPLARRHGRVVRIVAVGGAVVVAAWAIALYALKPAAGLEGDRLFHHRQVFRQILAPRGSKLPQVIWLGDSTIVHDSYPDALVPWFRQRFGAQSRAVAAAGMSTFNYYSLMGTALDAEPTMIVFLANLRMLRVAKPNTIPVTQFGDDLVSMIPARELPHAFTLPWMARSMSLARLLLLRVLENPLVERAMILTEGLGGVLQSNSPWKLVASAPPMPSEMERFGIFLAGNRIQAELYDVPLTPRQPCVQMMAATIRMATRRGVPVVVIASPIPMEFLKGHGYEADYFLPMFATLRTVAEREGAVFLDYHDAIVDPAMFSDNVGHYTPAGAEFLAEKMKAPLESTFLAAIARQRSH